ncbi:transposase [Corynebacterium sp. MSK072]|uniref:transposase n=1 Tax=Corynebacterium rhinophilum TaxID=3050197 RepID=UPI003312FB1F
MKASGSTVAEVCRDLGVSEATYHRWVKQYGEMSRSKPRRFKELQEKRQAYPPTRRSRVGKSATKRSLRRENSDPGTQI